MKKMNSEKRRWYYNTNFTNLHEIIFVEISLMVNDDERIVFKR